MRRATCRSMPTSRRANDAIRLGDLKLAIDDATVEGDLAWIRLSPEASAGRIEANLKAKRLDLDALPAAAALMPGGAALSPRPTSACRPSRSPLPASRRNPPMAGCAPAAS